MPRRDMLGPVSAPNGAENAVRGFTRGVNAFLRGPMRVAPSQVIRLRRPRLYAIIVQPPPPDEFSGPWFGGWMGEWL